ncbi:hypothetical protein ABT186_36680 [Streptomyces sp. NPDC001634]
MAKHRCRARRGDHLVKADAEIFGLCADPDASGDGCGTSKVTDEAPEAAV